jgi:hypothetical protein
MPDDDSYLVWSNEAIYPRGRTLDLSQSDPSIRARGGNSEIPVRAADVKEFLSGQLIPGAILEGEASWTND